jgi:hypothetical protein
MTVLPAHALSLNLGGDEPLVDLGNDNNADAGVSVDTGGVLGGSDSDSDGADANATVDVNLNDIAGSDDDDDTLDSVVDDDGDGGLVNLGGEDDLIELDNDGDSIIDLGGDDGDLLDLGDNGDPLELGGDDSLTGVADVDVDLGDGDRLLDLGNSGDLLDLGTGPLLDLRGDTDTDAVIEADLGGGELLDTGETGSLLDLAGTGELLDLGGTGDLLDLGSTGDLLDLGPGALLDLDGGNSEEVALDLGNTKIDADLNPSGDDAPLARATLSTGDDGVAGTGLLSDTDGTATVGGGNAANISLGTNDDGAGLGGGGSGGDSNGAAGNGGGGSASGNGSNSGGGSASPANGNGGSGNDDGDLFAAATTGTAACMTLDAAQLDQLMRRHVYNSATFNSWASARALKIVEVDFCDQAVADVAAAASGSDNVARLQAFLAAQAKVSAGLRSKGYAAGDVIAADHSGGVLIVYVI